MNVRRLGYALGAEITGIDLTKKLDDATVAEIRRIWLEHVVVCFPGQAMDGEQMTAFCSRFGEPKQHSNPSERLPDLPFLTLIVNKPVTIKGKSFTGGIGDEWHTDQSYTVRPPSASFLSAQEIPDVGGNTLFANMYLAYETLSPEFKRAIDPLESIFDVKHAEYFRRLPPERQADFADRHPPVVHPLVRVHPESGRKALYLGSRLRNFVGMTEEETKPLLDFLGDHAVRYEHTYRHRWSVNDLVMWDNRCALHRAVTDYDRSQLRRMVRCELLAPPSGYVYGEAKTLAS